MSRFAAEDLKCRFLGALDNDYNVKDMPTVIEVITQMEKLPISKDILEFTRLGRDLNGLRRKTTNVSLAKRIKALLEKWRIEIELPRSSSSSVNGNAATSGPGPGNSDESSLHSHYYSGLRQPSPAGSWTSNTSTSPALTLSRPVTPISRDVSPLLDTGTSLGVEYVCRNGPTSLDNLGTKKRKLDKSAMTQRSFTKQKVPNGVDVQMASRKVPTRKKPDLLEEKFASKAKTNKVKTTTELIVDLAQSSSASAKAPLTTCDKNSPISEKESPKDNAQFKSCDEKLREIYARLPPIDPSSINWDEDPYEPTPSASNVAQVVNNEPVEGLTGNFDADGTFKMWHESVTKETKDGETITLLPYCILD